MVEAMKTKAAAPNRFELARSEAADKANLYQAIVLLERAEAEVLRARRLLTTAISLEPAGRDLRKGEATKALSVVITDLREIVGEVSP